MTTKLKSNWMGSKTSSPVKFRAASNGNVFTRSEAENDLRGKGSRPSQGGTGRIDPSGAQQGGGRESQAGKVLRRDKRSSGAS